MKLNVKKHKYSIIENIHYYQLIWIVLIGLIIFTTRDKIFLFLAGMLGLNDYGLSRILYRLLYLAVNIGLVLGWIRGSFIVLRAKRYTRLTGRKYGPDHAAYNRSYNELVSYFMDAEPQKMDVNLLPEQRWTTSGGVIFGKYGRRLVSFEPKDNGIVGFVWGSPGDGKSRSVIIPTALRFGMQKEGDKFVQRGSCMVLDLKGEIYEVCRKKRKIKCFSLINPDHSCHFDPLLSARNMDDNDQETFFRELANTVVQNDGGDNGAYFTDVARDFLVGILLYTLNTDINISFPAICIDITTHSFAEYGQLVEESGYLPAIKYVAKFKDENEKNVGGGWSKLCKSLLIYTSHPVCKLLSDDDDHELIVPYDLEQCTDVFLQVAKTDVEVYASLLALIFNQFMRAVMQREEHKKPPICFILDEFGSLGYMPVIAQSAALMRAYNASILISIQSLSQIDKVYGENDRKILIDCSKYHSFLSIQDPDTREWASRLIGRKKVLRTGASVQNKDESQGRSSSEDTEFIIEPSYFGMLPSLETPSSLMYIRGQYILGQQCLYYQK